MSAALPGAPVANEERSDTVGLETISKEKCAGLWRQLTGESWGISALLALVTLLAYANSFPGTFILDDLLIVRSNPLVHHLDLVTTFRSDYWYSYDNSGLFRPLTILSLALNQMILGPEVWGFHLVNVLLHVTATVLLWQTLRVWGGDRVAAAGAALLFALHPIHTEVVNVVVGRSELLVVCLLLLAFLLARCDGLMARIGLGACYLLALLSKEHAIVFLALLPLWVAFTEGVRSSLRRLWPLYAALLAVTVAWLLWREFGVINPLPRSQLTEAAAPLAFVDGATRVLTALRCQGLYLSRLLVPTGLQAVYSVADLPPFVHSLLSFAGLVTVSATLVFGVLLVRGWRQHRPAALFLLFYCVAFLPTSNLLFPIGVSMAERLAYFPSVWFCAGLGALFAVVLRAPRLRVAGWGVMAVYVCWLGGTTLWRNLDFASPVQLWQAEVKNNPQDYLGWQNLATARAAVGEDDAAERGYLRMLEISPDYPGGLRTLVSFYISRGRFDQALPLALKVFAIMQRENDVISMAFDGLDLAMIYTGLGEHEKALSYLDGPALLLQDLERAHEVRGMALSSLGRDAEAVASFAGIALDQQKFRILKLYGKSLMVLGRLAEARVQLEEAVTGGDEAEAWNLLGVVCSQQQDWPAAMAAFARAVELQPENTHYRDNLLRAKGASTGPGKVPPP